MTATILESALQECPFEMPRSMGAELHTVTVRDFSKLRPHIAAWNSLAWSAPQQNAYSLPAWMEAAFQEALTPNEHWFCSFAYLGDELIGVLPAIVSAHPLLGRGYPILRTFDKHSQSGEILLCPDHASAALQALLLEAREVEPTHLGVDMKAVRPTSPLWKSLDAINGYVVRRGRQYRYSFLRVDGSHEAYIASLGNMRKNLKRYQRKLASRGQVSIEMKRGLAAEVAFLPEFLALEASGWKGRNGTAIASRSDSIAFYEALVKNLAAQEQLEWHIIRVDGRLAAAEIGIRCASALILLKTAYDEDFAECRPGNLLNAQMIYDAFGRPDINEINDMSDMEWHDSWRMSRDEYTNVHLVRQAAIPLLFHLPRIVSISLYQGYLRQWVPVTAKQFWRELRRPSRRRDVSR